MPTKKHARCEVDIKCGLNYWVGSLILTDLSLGIEKARRLLEKQCPGHEQVFLIAGKRSKRDKKD